MNCSFVCTVSENKKNLSFREIDKKLEKASFLDSDLTYEELEKLLGEMESKGQLCIRSSSKGSTETPTKHFDVNAVAKYHSIHSQYDALKDMILETLQTAVAFKSNRRVIWVIPQEFEDSSTKKWLHMEYHVLDIQHKRGGWTLLFAPMLCVRSIILGDRTGINMLTLKSGTKDMLSASVKVDGE